MEDVQNVWTSFDDGDGAAAFGHFAVNVGEVTDRFTVHVFEGFEVEDEVEATWVCFD